MSNYVSKTWFDENDPPLNYVPTYIWETSGGENTHEYEQLLPRGLQFKNKYRLYDNVWDI